MPHNATTRATALAKMQRLRAEWFAANGPCRECGSTDNLELDHIDRKDKVSHTVWSWAPKRRQLELIKCQPLCRRCHRKKSAAQRSSGPVRVVTKLRKISDKQVLKAVLLRKMGVPTRKIGQQMHVSHATVVRLTNAAMRGKDFHHRGSLLGS